MVSHQKESAVCVLTKNTLWILALSHCALWIKDAWVCFSTVFLNRVSAKILNLMQFQA